MKSCHWFPLFIAVLTVASRLQNPLQAQIGRAARQDLIDAIGHDGAIPGSALRIGNGYDPDVAVDGKAHPNVLPLPVQSRQSTIRPSQIGGQVYTYAQEMKSEQSLSSSRCSDFAVEAQASFLGASFKSDVSRVSTEVSQTSSNTVTYVLNFWQYQGFSEVNPGDFLLSDVAKQLAKDGNWALFRKVYGTRIVNREYYGWVVQLCFRAVANKSWTTSQIENHLSITGSYGNGSATLSQNSTDQLNQLASNSTVTVETFVRGNCGMVIPPPRRLDNAKVLQEILADTGKIILAVSANYYTVGFATIPTYSIDPVAFGGLANLQTSGRSGQIDSLNEKWSQTVRNYIEVTRLADGHDWGQDDHNKLMTLANVYERYANKIHQLAIDCTNLDVGTFPDPWESFQLTDAEATAIYGPAQPSNKHVPDLLSLDWIQRMQDRFPASVEFYIKSIHFTKFQPPVRLLRFYTAADTGPGSFIGENGYAGGTEVHNIGRSVVLRMPDKWSALKLTLGVYDGPIEDGAGTGDVGDAATALIDVKDFPKIYDKGPQTLNFTTLYAAGSLVYEVRRNLGP